MIEGILSSAAVNYSIIIKLCIPTGVQTLEVVARDEENWWDVGESMKTGQ